MNMPEDYELESRRHQYDLEALQEDMDLWTRLEEAENTPSLILQGVTYHGFPRCAAILNGGPTEEEHRMFDDGCPNHSD